MISNYGNKLTASFARGERVRQFESFGKAASRRLAALSSATSLQDLQAVRGNRLEALKGDRAGQFSIRINDQWRICFVWNEVERAAEKVEIVDYH